MKAKHSPPAGPKGHALLLQLQTALAHHQKGEWAQAEALYKAIIKSSPKQADALHLLGVIHHQQGKHTDAAKLIDSAIAINPTNPAYFSNRGNALRAAKKLPEALDSFQQAIKLKPDYAEAFNNMGNTLQEMKRLGEALSSYSQALKINPAYAKALNNQGYVLQQLKRMEEALTCYEHAIKIDPTYADALNNQGILLQHLKRFEEALSAYQRVLINQPDYPFVQGMVMHIKAHLCIWHDFDIHLKVLTLGVQRGLAVSYAFPLLALCDDPALIIRAAEIWVAAKATPSGLLGPIPHKPRGKKIHIAYLSADFHNHATTYLMAQLLEMHDKSRFYITAISFGPDKNDSMRKRVEQSVDRFESVTTKTDTEIAQLCRDMEVDIAIDLKGMTTDARPGILAERCAPIQMAWLGYPGTMGANFVDYLVADHTLIEPNEFEHYSEKIIYLPDTYQPNDRNRFISDKMFSRKECKLPETGFVFCCFNNNYKIIPQVFDVWMRLLSRVQGSVLWLLEDNALAAQHLKEEAQARGVDADRLVFAPRMDLPDHLARHRLADLFLDTWPCNAHTTASDALWAGLPVLTLRGRSFASRVAASLLNALGTPELIVQSIDNYEALAIELANHPETLAHIRQKIVANQLTTPLFDCARFTRHLESGFAQVLERYWAGSEPEHVIVQPIRQD